MGRLLRTGSYEVTVAGPVHTQRLPRHGRRFLSKARNQPYGEADHTRTTTHTHPHGRTPILTAIREGNTTKATPVLAHKPVGLRSARLGLWLRLRASLGRFGCLFA